MKRAWAGCVLVLLASAMAYGQGVRSVSSVESQQALVSEYCIGCHNDSQKSGNFSWESVDLARPDATAELSEKIIRKIRSGMMPPAGARRPDRASLNAFIAG